MSVVPAREAATEDVAGWVSHAPRRGRPATEAETWLLEGRWDSVIGVAGSTITQNVSGGEVGFCRRIVPAAMRDAGRVVLLRRGDGRQWWLSANETGGNGGLWLRSWAEALSLEASGAVAGALAVLQAEWEHAIRASDWPATYALCADLVRLADALGQERRLAAVASTIDELDHGSATSSIRAATADLCRGLADHDHQRLERGVARFKAANRPLHSGIAAEALAVRRARDGDVERARKAMDASCETFGALMAAWDMSRVSARLREFGIRRGVHGKRKRPKSGWEALTDIERRVAIMVAEGHSNPGIAARMFLSRRTVQTHVSSILGKLGLTSRVEIAVEAVRHAPAPVASVTRKPAS